LDIDLFNQSGFKFFSRPVRIFNRRPAHEILELDGRLGGTPRLFHNAKIQDLVGLAVNFHRQTVLDVGRVHRHHTSYY
jgi:hypothetical protein